MLRFLLILLLLLISLLAVFPAPEYHLWILAVIVTGFPYIFIGICIVFLMIQTKSKYQKAGNLTAIVALILFLSPVFRAYLVAVKLPENLEAVFGKKTVNLPDHPLKTPFSFLAMFSGIGGKAVSPQTFTYKTYPEISLQIDFYAVKTASKQPCVVVVHGGSWSGGDDKQLPGLNSYLARRGYQVASIDYRLAPEYKSTQALEDVQNAITYLKANAEKLQIDTNNFVLLGRSAGAQLALLAAYTFKNNGIKGVVDFYGPADMVFGYFVPSNPMVLDSHKVMEAYLGATYQQAKNRYKASSPILHVNAQSVPTLMIHGKNDVLVSYQHSVRLKQKLDSLGVKNYLLTLPWATHGCDYNLNGPGGQLSTYTVERFLHVVTSK
ncbi:alpha/beta hydrolase fold domain-containing protein [Mucilaginibacter sp.]|uniref:alpha/beta hydrolase fold domain-containing protein n=1 Tax=Mucilaginibacter sp. TaxID=1882438 RepID=UPI003AFFEE44